MATFNIVKIISFITLSDTWLKCLSSFQAKKSLIRQTRRLQMKWLIEAGFGFFQ